MPEDASNGEGVPSPEEREQAAMELISFAERWLDYIINYAQFIKRRMHKTGLTLPFDSPTFVKRGPNGFMVEVRVRVLIPHVIVDEYIRLKRHARIKLPKISYPTLRKIVKPKSGELEEDRESEEEVEAFKKDIYSDKV